MARAAVCGELRPTTVAATQRARERHPGRIRRVLGLGDRGDSAEHRGIRIEEMLELTQMSRRHCTSEATGTLVPLLHIVRTETDAERLIPMNPDESRTDRLDEPLPRCFV